MKFLCVKREWDTLEILNRQMDRLLDLEFESHELLARSAVRFPLVNLMQTSKEYVVTAELPGVAPEQIKLEITEDSLLLSGNREPTTQADEETFRRQERWGGPWKREVEFPRRADPDQVAAEMADGVLTVRIAKAEEVKPRQIAVVPKGLNGSGKA